MAGAWPCTVTIEIRHRIGNLPRVMTRTCLRLQRLQERGAAWSDFFQSTRRQLLIQGTTSLAALGHQ